MKAWIAAAGAFIGLGALALSRTAKADPSTSEDEDDEGDLILDEDDDGLPPAKDSSAEPDYVPGLIWPLPKVSKRNPTALGSFGASRGSKDGKKKLHAGTDIYAPAGSPVVAMEGGTVVNIVNGWAKGDTARILIQGDSGNVANYAAISKKSWEEFGIQEGDRVEAGETIARIGTYPKGSTMLHFELYRSGTKDNKRWYSGNRPPQLLDSEVWLGWSEEG